MKQDHIFESFHHEDDFAPTLNGYHEHESPFLDTSAAVGLTSPRQEVSSDFEFDGESPFSDESSTPFLSGAQSAEGPSAVQEAFWEMKHELYDEEFDDAIVSLANEAEQFFQDRLRTEGEADAYNHKVEQLLHNRFEPLILEAETLLDNFAQQAERYDLQAIDDQELEHLFDNLIPEHEEPAFDEFLKKMWRKAKRTVKKVARSAGRLANKGLKVMGKMLPVGAILRKLRGLVRPLLKRVLRMAINRLPVAVRPIARRLAKRFLGIIAEMETDEEAFSEEEAADMDFGTIQDEMDTVIATSLFTTEVLDSALYEGEMYDDELHDDEFTAPGTAYGSSQPASAYEQLAEARERFIQEFSQLQEGEDPTPVVERFVPALLPALKIGMKIIGRDRVIRFLAQYVARLISRFVGRRNAQLLARPLVDAGMRLMRLEAQEEEPAERVSAEMLSYTIENFVEQMLSYPPETFSEAETLQLVAQREFDEAVASTLPNELLKPELQEHSVRQGAWLLQPSNRKRKYYKKFSVVYPITLTAQMAKGIITFGGQRLFDTVEIPEGGQVKAKVHIYQAIRGTRLSRISRYEPRSIGLGSWSQQHWSQLHLLDKKAAGVLLSEPGLGVDKSGRFRSSRHMIAVGQRFFFLEGVSPTPRTPRTPRVNTGNGTGDGKKKPPITYTQPTRLYATYHTGARLASLSLFLGENDAARITRELESKRSLVAAEMLARHFVQQLVQLARNPRRVRIVQEVQHEEFLQAAAAAAAPVVIKWLTTKMLNLVEAYVKQKASQMSEQFRQAQKNPAEGVSVRLRLTLGMGLLAKLMATSIMGPVNPVTIMHLNPQFDILPGKKR